MREAALESARLGAPEAVLKLGNPVKSQVRSKVKIEHVHIWGSGDRIADNSVPNLGQITHNGMVKITQ